MTPSVTIAIPTFNRSRTLRRSVESALGQTHGDLEVIVSDNASTDDTAELLSELAGRDARLRVVRQPRNIGMVANLEAVGRLGDGEHVMLLADDDWLDPRCVELALDALSASPGAAAAVGQVAYVRDGERLDRGQPVPLTAETPQRRVRDYFAAVGVDDGNSWLYGLTRRTVLEQLPPLRNVLAFDWLRVSEIAFAGPIEVLDETLVYREAGGASETTERNVRESGLPPIQAKLPHLAIAGQIVADIGWRSPAYASLGRARRLALAAVCGAGVPVRNLGHVLFHLAPLSLQQRWRRRG